MGIVGIAVLKGEYMERLTNNQGYLIKCEGCIEESNCYSDISCNHIFYALNKLKEYEDLEEQGLLLKLPCKVGDTVWELCKCADGIYRTFPMKVAKVLPYGSVRWVKGKDPDMWNIYAVSDYTDMYKSFYDFGKTVFLTQDEAEAELKKIESEK